MRAVLFDFGGTLDTDGVHWSEKFWEYYERFKISVPKKSFERAFVYAEDELAEDPPPPASTLYAVLVRQLTLQFKQLRLPGQADEVMMRMVNACYADVGKAVAKAKPLLAALRPRYSLGLVSNFYGNLEVVCKELTLDPYFDAVIDSAVVGVRKPDPAIFLLALDRLHMPARDSYVVGDSYERDIVPGKLAGCRTIWLRGRSWKAHPSSAEAADFTVETLGQILPILS